jgi:hypothetical protein
MEFGFDGFVFTTSDKGVGQVGSSSFTPYHSNPVAAKFIGKELELFRTALSLCGPNDSGLSCKGLEFYF